MKKIYITCLLVVMGFTFTHAQLYNDGLVTNDGGLISDWQNQWFNTSGGVFDGYANGVFEHHGPSTSTFVNNGVFNAYGGHIDKFMGPLGATGAQEIGGAVRAYFHNLELINGAGQLINITNTDGVNVRNAATFSNGITTTIRANHQAGALRFENGASYTGGNADNQHVNGYVSKIGNTSFTFPVGSGTDIRTLLISSPATITDQYSVAWIAGDPTTTTDPSGSPAQHPVATFDAATLTAVSPVGQWDWISGANIPAVSSPTPASSPAGTGTGAGLNISVSIPDMTTFAAAANLRLVGWNGTQWVNLSTGTKPYSAGTSYASGVAENSILEGTMIAGITAIGIGTFGAQPVTISGFLWNDINGNGLTETGENTIYPATTYANLIQDDKVISRVALNSGAYTLTDIPGNTSGLSITLSANLVAVGAASSSLNNAAPSGYAYTLDNIGGIPNSATPGTVQNSTNNLSGISTTTNNLTGYNFGIKSSSGGYIYVHKSTLNEEASGDFSFTGTGGIPAFSLNDIQTSTNVIDIGAGGDRLWAIAGAGSASNTVYYQNYGSTSWVSTSASGVVAIDGGPNNDALVANAAGNVYLSTDGSSFGELSGASNATDVAFDKAGNNFLYRSSSNNGIYLRLSSGGGWNRIGGFTATRIDWSPVGDPIRLISTDGDVYSLTYGGSLTFIGRPSGQTLTDIAVTDDGILYVQTILKQVFRFTGNNSWVIEPTSRGGQNITGGPAGQVWEVNTNAPGNTQTIWTRSFDGTNGIWLDDQRVRTGINSNSVMIPVSAGTYTITEGSVPNWALQAIKVYDPGNNSSVPNVASKSAVVNVAAGEVVHILFQNGLTQSTLITNNCNSRFTEDFGSGAANSNGTALTGLTSYHWMGSTGSAVGSSVVDGYYAVVGTSNNAGYGTTFGFAETKDHTSGNGQDRYAFFNANYQKDIFYRRRFTGLIPGLTYTLSYWVVNITGGAAGTSTNLIAPNVKADVVDPSTGLSLGSNNSGDLNTVGVWQQKTFTFTATIADIDLMLSNNTIGGAGNDLGIDDISFGLAAVPAPEATVTAATCNTQASMTVISPKGAAYEYSIDGVTYQAGVTFFNLEPGTYSVTARYAGTEGCVSAVTTQTISPILCGNVLADANGLSGTPANTVDGTGMPGNVNVVLVNASNIVIASTTVDATGGYSFNLPGGSYKVLLSNSLPEPGTTFVSATYPEGYVSTGENIGTAAGNDGTSGGTTADGILAITVTPTANILNANFGINKTPEVTAETADLKPNPGGTVSSQVTFPVGQGYSATDAEDGNYPVLLAGNTVTLIPGAGGSLYYDTNGDGVGDATEQITASTPIPNFDPSKVLVDPTANGVTSVTFTYAISDNAGVAASPQTVTVPFSAAAQFSISGNVFNDGNALTDVGGGVVGTQGPEAITPVNGTSLEGIPLYATLLTGGSPVATVPIFNDGTYSFPNVSPGNYTIVLHTNPAGATSPSLPTGWNHTGENVGVGIGSDAAPDGILTGVTVAASDITDASFGINKQPQGEDATVSAQPNPGGTSQAPVSSDVFTATDQEDGTYPASLNGREVTLTSAANRNLYYNGNLITASLVIPSFNPALVTLDPIAPGATTGTSGAFPDPTFTYAVKDNAGIVSDPKTITVPFTDLSAVSVSGNVFGDANGNAVIDGSDANSVTDASESLTVYLTNGSGQIVAKADILSDGTYSTSVAPGTYTLTLSNDATLLVGASPASIPTALPADWTNTGTNFPGSGANPNNGASGLLTVGTTPVTNANFGINKTPVSDNKTGMLAQQPVGDSFILLDGSVPNAPELTGSDLEDQSVSGGLTGKTVAIVSLPTNGEIWYNGLKVSFGTDLSSPPSTTNPFVITALNPALLQLKLTGQGYSTTSFMYAYIDAAGVQDPTSATYTLTWSAPLPVTLARFSALKEGQTTLLTWTTTTETNSERFEVQHSTNGKDWRKIGGLDAKGESHQLASYALKHNNPVDGENLYRLKMFDIDQTFSYSRILSVKFEADFEVSLYPNPAVDVIQVKLTGVAGTDDIRSVKIYDLNGKAVYAESKIIDDQIKVHSLRPGAYVLAITHENGTVYHAKVVIVK